mmetsp:Transcript_15468/g.55653  ORF Transcript_15468/g.55653 Transcript_15468/m.55653 type:complete len:252 (+) Transcript_15468:182-937(+)
MMPVHDLEHPRDRIARELIAVVPGEVRAQSPRGAVPARPSPAVAVALRVVVRREARVHQRLAKVPRARELALVAPLATRSSRARAAAAAAFAPTRGPARTRTRRIVRVAMRVVLVASKHGAVVREAHVRARRDLVRVPVVHVLVHVPLRSEHLLAVEALPLRASDALFVLLLLQVHVLRSLERARGRDLERSRVPIDDGVKVVVQHRARAPRALARARGRGRVRIPGDGGDARCERRERDDAHRGDARHRA